MQNVTGFDSSDEDDTKYEYYSSGKDENVDDEIEEGEVLTIDDGKKLMYWNAN